MPLEAQWQHQKGLCSMGSARDIFTTSLVRN